MEFVAELKQLEILQSNHIILFKDYIQKKFPTASSHEKSLILADAINKAIGTHIEEFDIDIRDKVKLEVLKRAVIQDNYNINGNDILAACLSLAAEDGLKESLVLWLNKKCSYPIEREYLDQLFSEISDSSKELIAYDLEQSSTLKEKVTAQKLPYHILLASLLITIIFITYFALGNKDNIFSEENSSKIVQAEEITKKQIINSSLPNHLRYRAIDKDSLVKYLSGKNSLLCEEPYISAIMQASCEQDVNPLLLVAIAGQEQAYVPKNQSNAFLIANNPFNVYGSWKVYNTDILDSASIAAKTVVELSKNRPQSTDPLVWINRKYAEDKNWHEGVKKHLEALSREVKIVGDSI